MSNTCRRLNRSLVLVGLLVGFAVSSPTLGQENRYVEMGAVSSVRSPNPPSRRPPPVSVKQPSDKKDSNKTNEPAREAPLDEKQQKIKEAIDEGNKARDNFEYKKATASYQRVVELDPKDERAFYGLGNVYSDLACTDDAIRAYSDALRLKKDYRDALIALGYAYVKKEQFDEAEAHFTRAFKDNPSEAKVGIALASLAWKRKRHNEALAQLKLIADNQSIENVDRAAAHLVIGDIQLELKKWKEAAAEFKESIKLNPDSAPAYIKLGQTELHPEIERFGRLEPSGIRAEDKERLSKAAWQATEHFRHAINAKRFRHPNGYLFLAYGLISQFSYLEATQNITQFFNQVKELERQSATDALKCNSSGFKNLYISGYQALALTYTRESLLEKDSQKRLALVDKSIDAYRKILELDESNVDAHGMLAAFYRAQNKFPEAILEYEKALTHERNEERKAHYHAGIGMVYLSLGRYSEAIDSTNKARMNGGEPYMYLVQLALIHQRQGNHDEAIARMREAMKHEKEPAAHSFYYLATAYFLRARKNGSAEDFELAIEAAKNTIQINSSYSSAYLILGNIYRYHKNGTMINEAIANYELARQYDPTNSVIYFNLGDLYLTVKRNYDAAINYFLDAIKVKPDDPDAHFSLALAYRQKKDYAAAIKHIQEAIKYDDKSLNAYLELADIYEQQNLLREAIKWLLAATQKHPTNFYLYKELARLHSEIGQNPEAIQYYEESIKRLEDELQKELYRCRIERLRGRFADTITCFQKLTPSASWDPGQIVYELGMTYVASKNKKAAQAQYDQLKGLKTTLAEPLLKKINEMK